MKKQGFFDKKKVSIFDKAFPISLGLGLLISAFGGYSIVSGFLQNSQMKYDITRADTMINELERDLTQIDVISSELESTKTGLYTASVFGSEIADIQNKLIQETKAVVTNEVKMKELMDALSSKIINKSSVNIWLNIPQGESVDYKWKFETTHSFTEPIIPVLWSCYQNDKDKNMLAFATGSYNAETKLFSDVNVYYTSNGYNYLTGESSVTVQPAEDGSEVVIDDEV